MVSGISSSNSSGKVLLSPLAVTTSTTRTSPMVTFRKSPILRDLTALNDANESKEENLYDEDYYYSIDSSNLPQDNFIYFTYPCNVDDMMTYFYKDINSMTANSCSGSGD